MFPYWLHIRLQLLYHFSVPLCSTIQELPISATPLPLLPFSLKSPSFWSPAPPLHWNDNERRVAKCYGASKSFSHSVVDCFSLLWLSNDCNPLICAKVQGSLLDSLVFIYPSISWLISTSACHGLYILTLLTLKYLASSMTFSLNSSLLSPAAYLTSHLDESHNNLNVQTWLPITLPCCNVPVSVPGATIFPGFQTWTWESFFSLSPSHISKSRPLDF